MSSPLGVDQKIVILLFLIYNENYLGVYHNLEKGLAAWFSHRIVLIIFGSILRFEEC